MLPIPSAGPVTPGGSALTAPGGRDDHLLGAARAVRAASSFALGAQGLVADVEMLSGNGYAPGHAESALRLRREEPVLRALLEETC